MATIIDESRFPLVTLELTSPFTEDDLNALAQAIARIGQRSLLEKAPYAIAISADVVLGAERRRRLAELYGAIPEEVRNAGLQSFAHLHTPLVRGALRALQWSVPGLMAGTILVNSFAEAKARAEVELERHRQQLVPASLPSSQQITKPRLLARPS